MLKSFFFLVLISNFSEEEYAAVERVFTQNTGHIERLERFVEEKVCPFLEQKKDFLDIGAGPGSTTEKISPYFEATTIVEPNGEYEELYKKKSFLSKMGNFQDMTLEGQFDFALCSHVLYHVDQKEWAPFLKKMTGLIRPGGKGLVALVAPQGNFHALRHSINPDYSNSGKVEEALKSLGISYERFQHLSEFRVGNRSDFRALVRIFTLDDCYLPDAYARLSQEEKRGIEDKIDRFIETCLQPDGTYLFSDIDTFLLIHTNG